MKTVDLNCDMGESFGNYTCGMDEQVLPLITSANVACGFHASDPVVMSRTVRSAAKAGVHVGAHPGFPDLVGFGRRPMQCTPAQIQADVEYQIGALSAFCQAENISLSHVKPHGALYNMAVRELTVANAICAGIAAVNPALYLLAPGSSQMAAAAAQYHLPLASEVFADRAYMDDGSLVPRGREGAMITDPQEASRRVIRMIKEGLVTSISGKDIPVQADSVCIHGDSPRALAFAQEIARALKEEGIALKAFSA